MSETRHLSSVPQSEVQPELSLSEMSESLLNAVDNDTATPELQVALLEVADKIKAETIYYGGKTIQGTDEIVNQKTMTTYRFETKDADGNMVTTTMDAKVSQRLIEFAANHRTTAQQQAAEATATQPRKPRRIATRPQGAPKSFGSSSTKPIVVTHPNSKPASQAGAAGNHENDGANQKNLDFSAIADIVKIDVKRKGHRQDGKFLSKHEMGQIDKYQGLIRDGLSGRNQPPGNIDVPPAPGNQAPNAPDPDTLAPNGPDKSFMRDFPADMAYDLATTLNDWTNLAAARERSTITPGLTKQKVEAARQRYEELRKDAKEWTVAKMEELGLEPGDRVMISKFEDRTEAKLAGLGIKFEAERLANPTGPLADARKKFYDWWARQGGGDKFFSKKRLLGTAKKAAVMAAIGAPLGLAAGAAGVFLAGPLAGAAVATGVARGVSRGFLRGRIDKSANAISVAGAQYEQRVNAQHDKIDAVYAPNDEYSTPHEVTGVFAESINKNVRRNRVRVVGSAAIAAIAGGIGAEVAEHFWSGNGTGDQIGNSKAPETMPGLTDNSPKAPDAGQTPGLTTPPLTAPGAEALVAPRHMTLGHSGDSIWAETMHYAQEHGVKLDESQKQHIVSQILRSNGQTWASAHNLPVGYNFTINPHEMEEILKAA